MKDGIMGNYYPKKNYIQMKKTYFVHEWHWVEMKGKKMTHNIWTNNGRTSKIKNIYKETQ